jgi:pimeloyl-ACP methyl ester carboxylesterase
LETGFAPVSGSQLYYERKGIGTPVVLVHSGFLDRRMWDPQFESYAKQYSVVRYDIRGHGRSPAGETAYVDAEDLRSLLDHLKIADAFVVGNSNGARTVCGLAAGSPERVRGLVLIGGGPADLDPTAEEEARFVDSLPDRDEKILAFANEGRIAEAVEVMMDAWAPAVDDATRVYLRKIATDNFAAMMALRTGKFPNRQPSYPVAETLRHSPIPMLLICGERDHPALEMMMGRFSRQLLHAHFVKLPEADHTANLSARAEFDRVVLDFLAKTPARTASEN